MNCNYKNDLYFIIKKWKKMREIVHKIFYIMIDMYFDIFPYIYFILILECVFDISNMIYYKINNLRFENNKIMIINICITIILYIIKWIYNSIFYPLTLPLDLLTISNYIITGRKIQWKIEFHWNPI